MESNLKVFESLNCSLCKSPYAKSVKSPKGPHLLHCGKVVCNECWEKEEPLFKKERQHFCRWKGDCYYGAKPAFFLIEILNDPSIIESPNGNGYLLSKSLEEYGCPICHEEYSIEVEERKPYDLNCGHLICHGCFMVSRSDSEYENLPPTVNCPQCSHNGIYYYPSNTNPLQEFLQELPEITKQIKQMRLNVRTKCEEIECQREICFRSDCRRHKDCETVKFHWQEEITLLTPDSRSIQPQPVNVTSLNKHEVFQSLNCPLCFKPYSNSSRQDQSPTQTHCFGMAPICRKCFFTQKALSPRERLHQCATNRTCYDECFELFYIYDLLRSQSLKLDEEKGGWILTEKIKLPECPICHEEYSLAETELEPYSLRCGHLVCNGCFLKTQSSSMNAVLRNVCCPQCQQNFKYTRDSWENPLKDFLRELPQMIDKRKPTVTNDQKPCDECEERTLMLRMFKCHECDKSLCGECVARKHRQHETVDLQAEEVKKLMNNTRAIIELEIKTYDVYFPELHSQVLKNICDFQKKVLEQVDSIKELSFVKAKAEHQSYKLMSEKFEEICEKYLAEIRACNTGIEELINEIDEKQK